MLKLTFYGGAGEIGGNKILLEAEGSRIWLDFGLSYPREEEFFEFPLLRPACIDDLFKTGILPRLCGLYKNAGLSVAYSSEGMPAVCGNEEGCQTDAVLLSHAHMDHYGYLGMLRPDIPVFLSPIARKLIELRNDIHEDWLTRVDMDSLFPVGKDTEFGAGKLRVRRFDVDHSVLGASAYLIQAGDKTVVYTGDFRFHGSTRQASEGFLKSCQKAGVDILLCEGTRLGPPVKEEEEAEVRTLNDEAAVAERCRQILSHENGLVIYDASPADMNRMSLICQVAREFDRIPVFDSKKAYLLLYLNHPELLCSGLPSIGEFKIYLSRSQLPGNSSKRKELPADLYAEAYTDNRRGHEDRLLITQRRELNQKRKPRQGEEDWLALPDDCFIWGPLRDAILKEPGRYLLYTSSGPHTLLSLFPPDGKRLEGTYIYGKAEPFKEEMEFSFQRLVNWLRLCGLKLEYAHTSGHARPQDLERFISEVSPKVVIPIHTEHPELFQQWAPDVRIPHLGESLEL